MNKHGLTGQQLDIIHSVLAPYAEYIDCVGLFGSRATGTARPNSDIDLVLYGHLDDALEARIWTLFDTSKLALKVDVNAYALITYLPLKEHIDAVVQTLFTKAELLNSSGKAG